MRYKKDSMSLSNLALVLLIVVMTVTVNSRSCSTVVHASGAVNNNKGNVYTFLCGDSSITLINTRRGQVQNNVNITQLQGINFNDTINVKDEHEEFNTNITKGIDDNVVCRVTYVGTKGGSSKIANSGLLNFIK